jgi:hypothetical protein
MGPTTARLALALLITTLPLAAACASSAKPVCPTLSPLTAAAPWPPAKPKPLVKDLFKRDHAGAVSEADVRPILDAPVELVGSARLGVLPVAASYLPDPDLPLDSAPAALSDAALATGAFDAITKVSTVWPRQRAATGGPGDWAIPMLRELAARYRTD